MNSVETIEKDIMERFMEQNKNNKKYTMKYLINNMGMIQMHPSGMVCKGTIRNIQSNLG
jgi:hypothetical protein